MVIIPVQTRSPRKAKVGDEKSPVLMVLYSIVRVSMTNENMIAYRLNYIIDDVR